MDSDSDSSEYVPDEVVEKEEEGLAKVDLNKADALFREISKNDEPKSVKNNVGIEEAMQAAKSIKSRLNEPPKVVSGQFAGEKVTFELGKRQKSGIDQVLNEVKKPKPMNSLSKSTIDWEKFKKTNNLENSLEKNRKDGFIGKKNFLLETKEREKSQLSDLKRKKIN